MITLSPEDVKEQNKELVRRFYTLAYVQHDLLHAGRMLAPDYVLHDPTLKDQQLAGVQNWTQLQGNYLKAIPEHRLTIEDMVAEGDRVVTRWSVSGVEDGFLLTGITISRVQDGQIAEEWQDWDSEGLHRRNNIEPPAKMRAA